MGDFFEAQAAMLQGFLGMQAQAQAGTAQASIRADAARDAAGVQALAQTTSAQLGLDGTKYSSDKKLEDTILQIAGQLDLSTDKGKQQMEQLVEKLKNEKDIASQQRAAQKAVANIQQTGQIQAAGKSASATIQASKISADASRFGSAQGLKGSQRQAQASEFGATTSAAAQKETAKTQAQAQKDVAKMGIQAQLGTAGSGFGQGTIAAQSSAKQEQDLQQIQAQLGQGGFGDGVIAKTQQEQLAREKTLAELSASQQLGTGAYADSGGIIGAQSAAKISETEAAGAEQLAQIAAQNAAKLGTGEYATLGEIAAQGIEGRETQAQRAELAATNMQTHSDILDVQQQKIAERLGSINIPFSNIFNGQGGPANMINAASQSAPQQAAMNLLSSGQNPYNQPLQGLGGMVGAGAGGPNQLLAMQGAMNAQNTLGQAANQQFGANALAAGGNLAAQFQQAGATGTQAMQPYGTAYGSALGAVPQAQAAALAGMSNIGIS